MKLKWLFLVLSLFYASNGVAADAGMRYIQTNGKVRCGTDLKTDAYARKDENGDWRGIDADMCRIFSLAAFGRSNAFELINIDPQDAGTALATNKIDIMLGNTPFSASSEISGLGRPSEVIYYDRLMFMARDTKKATSMLGFNGQNLCAVSNSDDLYYLEQFANHYKLQFNMLKFANFDNAKSAFLLNRCNLLIGNETKLTALQQSLNKPEIRILPEILAYKPVYAVTARDNSSLQMGIKWVINSLALAEEFGMTAQNVDIFKASGNKTVRNLLGTDPELWKKFNLSPDWVKKAIKEVGNYGQIYERNLGNESSLKIKRDKNKLIKDGGLVRTQSFL